MTAPELDLQALREAVEAVDRDLLALLRRRMDLVEEVARAKLGSAWPFRDPQREDQIIQRLRHAAVERGLDAHQVERLYRVILDMSVAHQKAHVRSLAAAPVRVAYQGVEGSYSHLTAQQKYAGLAEGVLLEGFETFRAAAQAVAEGAVDLAFLPIENTTAGSINETYDLLALGGLTITGEAVARIEHCLLGLPGATIEGLGLVLSHPQALLQCQAFLRTLPRAVQQAEFDTAGAARKVRERNDPTVAAVASAAAGRLYGLAVLARAIQTEEGNYTRFVELARDPVPCPPGTPAKTSLLLTLPHRPGALSEVLGALAQRGVNLGKLESRPIPESPFRYRFYLDVEGNAHCDPVKSALEALRPLTAELSMLGTYPSAGTAV